jgi:hypothetical protein
MDVQKAARYFNNHDFYHTFPRITSVNLIFKPDKMKDKIILWTPNEPEGYGVCDQNQEPVEPKFDLNLIDNIEFDDVDMADAPDFSDAYISSADYDGVPMTDDELVDLNEKHPGFVYEKLFNRLY